MALSAGDPAPAFTLAPRPREAVDLGEHIGSRKVVLLFIPFAFSSVCTRELCAIGEEWDRWEDLDADLFAIAVDSPFVVDRFREQEEIPFPVLSDFGRRASEAYGVLTDAYLGTPGVAKRSVFVIDADGRVAWSWVTDDPGVEPSYEAVRAAVRNA